MEYPGTKFTRVWRRLLLVVFIVAFFIISPIVIMYSLGYRYDWHNGFLRQTGAISIDIEPKKVNIYLDDNKLKETAMPVRLKNIVPKKYNLKITAPGYYDFVKEIEVGRKQTIYIKEISLIKKNKPEILINETVDSFADSFDHKYIIYSALKNKQLEILLWNKKNNSASLLFKKTDAKSIQIHWASKNNCAAITNLNPPYNYLKIFCVDKEQVTDLMAQATTTAQKILWRESASPELYFSTKKDIFLFYSTTGQTQKITDNNFIDWYIDNGQLWVLQFNTSSKQYEIIKDKLGFSNKIARLEVTDASTNTLKLLSVKRNQALLKKDGQAEMVLARSDKNINIAGEKYLLSQYNNWWLFWTPWELWTYVEGETPDLKTRSGENLADVIPLDKYNTLALVWENKTTVLIPYYLITNNLVEGKIKQAVADSENKIFYYTLRDKQGLWQLKY